MDNQKIQILIQDALEDEIPSADIHLWPDVKALVAGTIPSQGVTPMNTLPSRRIPRGALAILTVIALFALGLTTPQGRTFAQEILQFFTRAESDTFPLDPSKRPPLPDETTEEPYNIFNANRTVSEVEAAVDFEVLEPTWLPEELSFSGANFDPENKIAYLLYDYRQGEGNGLVLKQEPFQTTEDCELCYTVGTSANVEIIQIGDVSGEYVEGVWKLNGTEAVWESDPYLKRMLWQANGMAYELLFTGPFDSVTKADMIAIAASLAPSSPQAPQPTPLISVAEAEAQAGFDAAELSFVPEGFTFFGARLYGNTINIEYETPDQGGHLNITQSQEGYYKSDWDNVPAEFIIPVKIGELDGEFIQGRFVVFPNATEATWNSDAPILRLRWEKDGIWYEIIKSGGARPIEYLDQASLIALAEDLIAQP